MSVKNNTNLIHWYGYQPAFRWSLDTVVFSFTVAGNKVEWLWLMMRHHGPDGNAFHVAFIGQQQPTQIKKKGSDKDNITPIHSQMDGQA